MNKVKKEIVEAAVLKLLSNITQTMPSAAHKFLMGSVSALAALNNRKKIDDFLGMAADRDGYIDVEQISAVVEGGFAATDGKIQLEMFRDRGGIVSMLVKPLTLTITKDDISAIMSEIMENSVKVTRSSDENDTVAAAAPAA